ncbi:hypothetical protein HP532_00085 [Pseudomonas sp. CrR25]|nr:hypothetical protein [Pseudomonas sp. CrR25]
MQLSQRVDHLETLNQRLNHELVVLRRHRFARRSEQLNVDQLRTDAAGNGWRGEGPQGCTAESSASTRPVRPAPHYGRAPARRRCLVPFQPGGPSMSYAPASPSATQTQTESIGYLALTYVGKRLPLQVRQSGIGHFIGTADENDPVSRESVEHFRSCQAAEQALGTGRWQQRLHP